jgi:putative CocE/NonD family hydrolase
VHELSTALPSATTRAAQFKVRREPNLLIPLDDGSELAASALLPDAPGRFPALLQFYPYHKDGEVGAQLVYWDQYFAERGYASLLVDLRGLGGSSGTSAGPFSEREGPDMTAAIAWAASQPWCDGSVGVWGMSYGGIAALRSAAEQPPQLKAIVPIMGCLDLYDAWYYPGGCRNCLGIGRWESLVLGLHLAPPMHHDPDGRWYRVWRERLENSEPWMLAWRDHPTYDAFWQPKAIDPGRIQTPTFLIGGWRDVFPEAMVQAYARIEAPRKLWMGPWLHDSPDASVFAPTEFLPEVCRWWDQWLRGEDTGVTRQPPVDYYVQGAGRWRQTSAWPPVGTNELTLFLGHTGSLAEQASVDEESVSYLADPTVGATAGLWSGANAPLDQGADDLRSLTFTGEPLPEPLELTGTANAILHIAIEEGDDANLVVKLCDVSPTEASTLIASGVLRASHRGSSEHPEPPAPGQLYEYRVSLWATSYELARGHRLRVSVSCADFPRIWPTPHNPRLRLFLGGAHASMVRIPVVHSAQESHELEPADPSVNRWPLLQGDDNWTIAHEPVRKAVAVTYDARWALSPPGGAGAIENDETITARVAADRPDGARVEASYRMRFQLPSGGEALVETQTQSTQHGLALSGRVHIDGHLIFERHWQK